MSFHQLGSIRRSRANRKNRFVATRESSFRANTPLFKRKVGPSAKAKVGLCATPEQMISSRGNSLRGHSLGRNFGNACRSKWSVTHSTSKTDSRWVLALLALGLSATLLGCSGESDSTVKPAGDDLNTKSKPAGLPPAASQGEGPVYSVDAKHDVHNMLRSGMTTPLDPSDGGGKAWLVSGARINGTPGPLRAGEAGRLEFIYEAGPLGVAVDGEVHFQVSSFWEWDPPQNKDPESRGYTTVRTDADGVELTPVWHGTELLAIGIAGRSLEAGEQIHVTYGAGKLGAKVDIFAERGAEHWFSVDGDGDGLRKFIDTPATVDIISAPSAQLVVMVPTTLEPGEEFIAFVSILDKTGSTGTRFSGIVEFDAPDGIELPASVEFIGDEGGRQRVPGIARKAGVHRISATAISGKGQKLEYKATANPIVVEENIARVRWADIHGHSKLSDGTGTPDDYFTYAREVAGLDIVSLTDHDHWGIQFLDEHPELWQLIRDTVKAHHRPGEFVTVLGYEWTSWLHGHRHVLYFQDEGEIYSALDPKYENPMQLWDALSGQPALTFAHHSAGGPVSTNWYYPPHSVLEPVTEISSVHGSSESYDSPSAIYNPVRGNFVRDLLNVGFRVGFIGSGDGHDGHPGLAHLGNDGGGGLAAIFTEELSREGTLEALRARRTYATNGARIWMQVSLDDHVMGTTMPPRTEADAATQTLKIRVVSEGPLKHVDIVRSGNVSRLDLNGELDWSNERVIPRLGRGEYQYIRVIEESGALAWSSPIFAN